MFKTKLNVVAVLFHEVDHVSGPHGFVADRTNGSQVVNFKSTAVHFAENVANFKLGLAYSHPFAANALVFRNIFTDIGRPDVHTNFGRNFDFFSRC
jgi:hypothetical protein